MKIDNAMLIKLEEFKQKEKFQEDMKILYPGIGNEKLKPLLTEKINLVANDFQNLIKSGDRSEADFQAVSYTHLDVYKRQVHVKHMDLSNPFDFLDVLI